MTIRQQGGVFGRNPVFNDLSANSASFTALTAGASSLGAITGTSFNIAQFKTGTNILESNAAGQNGARLRAAVSSASFPTFSFTSDNNTGLYNPTADVLGVSVGGAEAGSFTSNGLAFPNGKGIDFSATSGTGTSELFDDYEEGTWTPVAADAETGGNTGTAGVANGYYTKVGNVVYVMGVLSNVNTTGLTSGNLFYIQGLPFSSKDLVGATAYYMSGGVLTSAVTITGNVQMYLNDLSKTSVAFFDAGGNILVSDLTSAAADFYFSLTYMAA